MTTTIQEIQEEIVSEFDLFDTWEDKYNYIIELGKKLEPLPDLFKTEKNIVKGCQSLVWLHAEKEENQTIIFKADSDAIIVKGLVSLLIRVFSGHQAEEILNSELFVFEKIGLKEHLSMTRANGLVSMIKQIKLTALAYNS